MIHPDQLGLLLPRAVAWAEQMEVRALSEGTPLSATNLADAATIGVRSPHKVRLLSVPEMPKPDEPTLRSAAEATGLLSSSTIGLSLRYGIFIHHEYWGDRRLIAHELVHTSQYERLGGFAPFLEQYLLECIMPPGYPHGPLESEADRISKEICRG